MKLIEEYSRLGKVVDFRVGDEDEQLRKCYSMGGGPLHVLPHSYGMRSLFQ
jgi:hypothetical protein